MTNETESERPKFRDNASLTGLNRSRFSSGLNRAGKYWAGRYVLGFNLTI